MRKVTGNDKNKMFAMKVLRKVRITCRVCSLTMHSNKSHLCKEMTVIRYLSQTCHIVGHFITKFGI